jgi:hypothetical protein
MTNGRSDEISAVAESRTGLRDPTKGEPRASGPRRSRNVVENKASCKNVMRIPTMNRQLSRLRFGAPHRGWRQNLGSKLECDLESVANEPRFHHLQPSMNCNPLWLWVRRAVVVYQFKLTHCRPAPDSDLDKASRNPLRNEAHRLAERVLVI